MAGDLPLHITIARQLGSGGSYLAQRLAHRLGFVYLDHQILEQAAQELDISNSELVQREERTQSFWAKLLEAFAAGCPEDIQSPPSLRLISDDELIAADPEAAEKMIDRTDNDRRRYVQKICGASWYDARNYHLTIDMSRVGFEAAEEMIVAMAKRLMEQGDAAPQPQNGSRKGRST